MSAKNIKIKKRKSGKPAEALLFFGIAMAIIGFSGIGYIPGKGVTATLIFAAVMVAGVWVVGRYFKALLKGRSV